MKIKHAVYLAAFTLMVGGCVVSPSRQIETGHVVLLPQTITVSPYGMNFKISAVVEAQGDRTLILTYATDCQNGHGELVTEPGTNYKKSVQLDNLLVSGTTPADRLFSQLCATGFPIAQRIQAGRSPAEQKQIAAQSAAAIGAALNLNATSSQQQNTTHRGVHYTGPSAAPTTPTQTTCTDNGAGFTCQKQ